MNALKIVMISFFTHMMTFLLIPTRRIIYYYKKNWKWGKWEKIRKFERRKTSSKNIKIIFKFDWSSTKVDLRVDLRLRLLYVFHHFHSSRMISKKIKEINWKKNSRILVIFSIISYQISTPPKIFIKNTKLIKNKTNS